MATGQQDVATTIPGGAEPPALLALRVIRELMAIFKYERAIYLVGAGLGMLLLLYAAYRTIEGSTDPKLAGYYFGSGGIFALAGGRVLYVLNRAFTLMEKVLIGGKDGAP
jgi:hypothetical protein